MVRLMHIAILGLLSLVVTTSSAQMLSIELPTGRRAAILQALAEPVKFHFNEIRLEEVANAISRQHNVDIYLDAWSLDQVGVSGDTPVTSRARGTPLGIALKHLLRDVDSTVVWTLFDDRLTITTREAEEENLTTVIYDVWPLTPDGDFDSLFELITRTIEPDSWDEVGGPGSMSEYYAPGIRALVVSQTLDIHQRINTLLIKLHQLGGHAMRAAPALRSSRPSVITVSPTYAIRSRGRSSVTNPRNIPMTRPRSTRDRTDARNARSRRSMVAAPAWSQPGTPNRQSAPGGGGGF